MQIDFNFYGDQQVSRRILRWQEAAADARPAFEAVADMLMEHEDQQFETQGGLASGGWAALKPATVQAKARQGLDPRILHATLALRRSLTERGDENQELIIEPSWMLFKSKLEYAGFHQTGTRHMPQRRPIELREQDRQEVVKIVQEFLVYGDV